MEEEKKKNKNKKKKGRKGKAAESVAVSVEETSSLEQNHEGELQQSQCVSNSGNDELIQDSIMSKVDPELERHKNGEMKALTSVSVLEEEVRQLEAEKNSWLQREKRLEEEIKKVVVEKSSWILKEANLEEQIKCLQNEKHSCILKEVSLENKIHELQSERYSWIQKEASLEEKIKELQTDQNSWILKENSAKEIIRRLNDVNLVLQAQVKELEESSDGLLQENQRLMENNYLLETRVADHEGEGSPAFLAAEKTMHVSNGEAHDNFIEAARALVEKLIVENSELVEKVNVLCIELDRYRQTTSHSSAFSFDQATVETAAHADSLLEQKILESDKNVGSPAIIASIPTNDIVDVNNADIESNTVVEIQPEESLASHNANETEEIVLVPLEENDVSKVQSQVPESDDQSGVPLTDAPLIGAPFRLISFVAKYVSGADLVDKNMSNSHG